MSRSLNWWRCALCAAALMTTTMSYAALGEQRAPLERNAARRDGAYGAGSMNRLVRLAADNDPAVGDWDGGGKPGDGDYGYYGIESGSCGAGCGDGENNCDPCFDDCGVECGAVCTCPPPCHNPRWRMFGEFLYLQVTDADVAHAQQQDGIGGAGTAPFGEIGTIGEDFNPGFRVGGSVACGPCTSVLVSFTQYESDANEHLDAPDSSNGAVGSLVHHPGAALTASAGPVDAAYDVDFKLADVMWRKILTDNGRYAVAVSCGVEYGHLDQQFAQNGIFGGGSGGEIDTSTAINFDGGGIKIGVDAEHMFGRGLGIYASLTAAALTGRFSSQYSMYNATTDQMLAMAGWKDDRVIGQIEYEVGMSLTSANDHWRVAAGYMFSYWTNVVTTSDFIDAVQADNYTDVGNTLGFNGLVMRVECRW